MAKTILCCIQLAPHWRHEKFNKWLGTYLSKYGMLINDQPILKYVLSSKKNYFQHCHMSVNPKDLHVDFVLPNFNLCLFENEADEEAELLP